MFPTTRCLCPMRTRPGRFRIPGLPGRERDHPFKQLALAACDEVDEKAAAIGAVNTVINRSGRLYGCNTDYAGFAYMTKAGGHCFFKTARCCCWAPAAPSRTVTAVARDQEREGGPSGLPQRQKRRAVHEDAMKRKDVEVVVNVSPCGHVPQQWECLWT